MRTVVDEDSARVVRTLINRILLAAVGAVFCPGRARLLLAANDKGPMVSTDTGLFEILGYGGLLAGTVLLFRTFSGRSSRETGRPDDRCSRTTAQHHRTQGAGQRP